MNNYKLTEKDIAKIEKALKTGDRVEIIPVKTGIKIVKLMIIL